MAWLPDGEYKERTGSSRYKENTLKVTQMADFMNQDTNTRSSRREWRQFVSRMERESTGKRPDNYKVAEMGDAIYYGCG